MLDEGAAVSVVVPVYNSVSTLPTLVDRLAPVLGSLGTEFEIILVNDGSRDASWRTIAALARTRSPFRSVGALADYVTTLLQEQR